MTETEVLDILRHFIARQGLRWGIFSSTPNLYFDYLLSAIWERFKQCLWNQNVPVARVFCFADTMYLGAETFGLKLFSS